MVFLMHGREIDVERLVLRPLRLTSDALYTKARSLRGDGEMGTSILLILLQEMRRGPPTFLV